MQLPHVFINPLNEVFKNNTNILLSLIGCICGTNLATSSHFIETYVGIRQLQDPYTVHLKKSPFGNLKSSPSFCLLF